MKLFRSKTLILIFSSFALALSACIPADVPPTPASTQLSVDAIHTQAAATIYAGQTGTANAQPSSTPTATNTLTRTATLTSTPTLTKVVYVPVQPVYTVIVTTTGTPGTRVPLPTATYGAVGCNNSAFIQDMSIPNNTKLSAGTSFTKTWRIKNTGTCNWSFNYKFTYTGGQLFNSDTTKIRRTVGKSLTGNFSEVNTNMMKAASNCCADAVQ